MDQEHKEYKELKVQEVTFRKEKGVYSFVVPIHPFIIYTLSEDEIHNSETAEIVRDKAIRQWITDLKYFSKNWPEPEVRDQLKITLEKRINQLLDSWSISYNEGILMDMIISEKNSVCGVHSKYNDKIELSKKTLYLDEGKIEEYCISKPKKERNNHLYLAEGYGWKSWGDTKYLDKAIFLRNNVIEYHNELLRRALQRKID